MNTLRGPRGRFLPSPRGVGGAPRGNLNGVKHPWLSFWRRRALRSEDSWVRKIVSEHAGSLLSDKPDASEAERHVIEVASVARGCQCLLLDAMARAGGVETEQGFAMLTALSRFLSLEQKALVAVGLERRAKHVDPMDALRAAEKRANEGATE